MADPGVLLVARVHGLGGRADELRAAARRLASEATAEGCLSFDVLEVADQAGELVLLQAWTDDAAMRAHFASAAYGRYVDTVSDLLARPSDVVLHHVASTTHPIADLSAEPRRAD